MLSIINLKAGTCPKKGGLLILTTLAISIMLLALPTTSRRIKDVFHSEKIKGHIRKNYRFYKKCKLENPSKQIQYIKKRNKWWSWWLECILE